MRYTTKYKFNLIETSDTFNPDALNANAETAERELARVESQAAADKAELAAAITAGDAALEKALATQKSTLAAADAALEKADAALQTAIGVGLQGKVARVAAGTVKGVEGSLTMNFDFKPQLLLFADNNGPTMDSRATYLLVRDSPGVDDTNPSHRRTGTVTWGNTSVTITGSSSINSAFNTLYYVVFGESTQA